MRSFSIIIRQFRTFPVRELYMTTLENDMRFCPGRYSLPEKDYKSGNGKWFYESKNLFPTDKFNGRYSGCQTSRLRLVCDLQRSKDAFFSTSKSKCSASSPLASPCPHLYRVPAPAKQPNPPQEQNYRYRPDSDPHSTIPALPHSILP